ncbi:hypothetical protein TYRP_012999 [Tyrophagus putrescentiae]|nr:hypothetical protein TYRP_012999 [Tyrophagus putrescentiae]
MSSGGSSSYSSSSNMGGSGSSYDSGSSYGSSNPISVSRKVNHRVRYYDTPTSSNSKPTFVEVGSSPGVINFLFRSSSSYINAKQQHDSAKGSNQESQSEDEAHYLRHTVTKPITQELYEILVPKRKTVQEIRPVEEEIETVVARNQNQGYGSSSYGSSSSKSYGSGSKGVILLMITFFNLIESRPNGNPNSQSRNLITIIPGGISSSTRRMSTRLPDTSSLITSPSEQYLQLRKRQFFRQSDQYAPSSSSYLNIETSNYGDSDSLHQDIPLYRDEGTSSFSKRYLVAESNSNAYPSSQGGYSQQPAFQSYSSYGGQVIPAAIQSKHQVSYYEVPSTNEPAKPTTIEVGASSVPLNILFRSASSNLNIKQAHEGSHGTTQETESQDEPHYLKHQVIKPIYQRVTELIKPIRYIQQQILPVQETLVTRIATVAREGGKKRVQQPKARQSTEHSAEYLAGSTRNNYQAVEQRHETAAPIAPPPPPPTIVTSSVQHLVQAPEYQQPSSQVASIASNADDQISAMHNSYQPEMIAVSRRSSGIEEEEQQRFVPTEAAATEPEPNDYQQHQQQLIDQIGQRVHDS